MTFEKLSPKQAEIFKFPHEGYDALICDGAVRSGKTMMMIYAFIWWAMERFDGAVFGVCGKTVQSAERNIIHPLLATKSITDRYSTTYTRSMKVLTISRNEKINYFYIFGGKDESSYMLIQGLTLSGVLLDEVALMPRSFVEQAITRTLSVDDAKLWFNCNPESPHHWFYLEWIKNSEHHNAKRLHFLMTDNPGLSEKAIARAERDFAGVFYDRYVLGLWVLAEGLIYSMFDKKTHVIPTNEIPPGNEYVISIDYGTSNPTSAGLWRVVNGIGYRIKEYYHDGRKQGQLTDEEHMNNIIELAQSVPGAYPTAQVIVDPSAASLITCFRRHGAFQTLNANNDVIEGIRNVSSALKNNRLFISEECENAKISLESYVWDEKSIEERPLKENDHACDDIRYFVRTYLKRYYKDFV